MKCPWRITKEVRKNGMGLTMSETHFDECYKNECPFYEYADGTNGEIVYEGCQRKEKI